MRIPLDYYRILGLPIQATAEQLKQAHRDRTLQLPRREYSEGAIATRRQLIDEAYAVLSSPEKRRDYDEGFLAKTYEPDLEASSSSGVSQSTNRPEAADPSPSIEIQDRQLIGALLILQELGEYELVLRLGRPYLTSGSANLRDGKLGDPKIVLSDIVLTVALACLELGREQWQQGQYENAAEALETGQELLLREGLFASVRGEIQADLFKLRPYRILELLALPDEQSPDRHRGLRLLQDMLRERGGIDGTGNDQSGLSIDDFLRFIQQLRGYLTAEEQQTLFEEEARRPSAVATYLAVYALMARGFARQQPALIRRAKLMLVRLGSRQDVHLEQAVCSLLLGQTEEASRALELSQEYEPLAFIRENSQGAPDLLPGLCLYAERWLQDEVFPHFRDLAQQKAALKDYFANDQVQEYLEELPVEAEPIEWGANPIGRSTPTRQNGRVDQSVHSVSRASTATIATDDRLTDDVLAMPAAQRLSQLSPEGSLQTDSSPPVGTRTRPRVDRPRGELNNGHRIPDADDLPPRRSDGRPAKTRRKSRLSLPLVLLGILAVGALGFLLIRGLRALTGQSAGNELLVQLDQPVMAIPEVVPDSPLAGDMNEATAQRVLEFWLNTKKEAMGESYATTKLNQILVEPKLAEWRASSEEAKREGLHIQYEHTIKVDSVEANSTDPNQAIVTATASEVRKYYRGGSLFDTQTDTNLKVRYSLIRQDNQWRIKDWQVQ
ncbi:IMS domain-containing protein [Phormidesmis sp. 146-33]